MPCVITYPGNYWKTWRNWTNTGVPAGTTLTVNAGNLSTTANGQTINALDIQGDLSINHTNVTVQNCKVWHIVGFNDITGLIIQDCTINGQNQNTAVACIEIDLFVTVAGSIRITRCNISNCENGISIGAPCSGTVVEDCYFHDHHNDTAPDPHIDGCVVWPGVSNVTITRCNFDMLRGTTSSCTTSRDAINLVINACRLNNGSSLINYDGVYSGCVVQYCTLIPSPNAGGGYFDTIGTNGTGTVADFNNAVLHSGQT